MKGDLFRVDQTVRRGLALSYHGYGGERIEVGQRPPDIERQRRIVDLLQPGGIGRVGDGKNENIQPAAALNDAACRSKAARFEPLTLARVKAAKLRKLLRRRLIHRLRRAEMLQQAHGKNLRSLYSSVSFIQSRHCSSRSVPFIDSSPT